MAAVKDRLKSDLKASMKSRDAARLTVLRSALAAITTEEVSGAEARELTTEQEERVLAKQLRQRRESAAEYAKANRQDLVDVELAEAEVLAEYLPEPLTEAEVRSLVEGEIAAYQETAGEAPTMRQMGRLVQLVSAKASGRADGKVIAGMVKAAISS